MYTYNNQDNMYIVIDIHTPYIAISGVNEAHRTHALKTRHYKKRFGVVEDCLHVITKPEAKLDSAVQLQITRSESEPSSMKHRTNVPDFSCFALQFDPSFGRKHSEGQRTVTVLKVQFVILV